MDVDCNVVWVWVRLACAPNDWLVNTTVLVMVSIRPYTDTFEVSFGL